jgi:hypothetical protein
VTASARAIGLCAAASVLLAADPISPRESAFMRWNAAVVAYGDHPAKDASRTERWASRRTVSVSDRTDYAIESWAAARGQVAATAAVLVPGLWLSGLNAERKAPPGVPLPEGAGRAWPMVLRPAGVTRIVCPWIDPSSAIGKQLRNAGGEHLPWNAACSVGAQTYQAIRKATVEDVADFVQDGNLFQQLVPYVGSSPQPDPAKDDRSVKKITGALSRQPKLADISDGLLDDAVRMSDGIIAKIRRDQRGWEPVRVGQRRVGEAIMRGVEAIDDAACGPGSERRLDLNPHAMVLYARLLALSDLTNIPSVTNSGRPVTGVHKLGKLTGGVSTLSMLESLVFASDGPPAALDDAGLDPGRAQALGLAIVLEALVDEYDDGYPGLDVVSASGEVPACRRGSPVDWPTAYEPVNKNSMTDERRCVVFGGKTAEMFPSTLDDWWWKGYTTRKKGDTAGPWRDFRRELARLIGDGGDSIVTRWRGVIPDLERIAAGTADATRSVREALTMSVPGLPIGPAIGNPGKYDHYRTMAHLARFADANDGIGEAFAGMFWRRFHVARAKAEALAVRGWRATDAQDLPVWLPVLRVLHTRRIALAVLDAQLGRSWGATGTIQDAPGTQNGWEYIFTSEQLKPYKGDVWAFVAETYLAPKKHAVVQRTPAWVKSIGVMDIRMLILAHQIALANAEAVIVAEMAIRDDLLMGKPRKLDGQPTDDDDTSRRGR